MARSHESFNKKEQEKKRIKKKQDKEQKREERKANSGKGKSLDDMIAYIDEFGNITSTPPDLTKKKTEISLDDIQIGVAKRVDEPEEDPVRQGTVTYYNDSKGYGFIRDAKTQESIFVHANQLNGPIKERDKVSFEVEQGKKGPNAVRVKVL